MTGRFLPDKAIDLLDEAAAARRIADASGNRRALTPADIARVVSKASGVPAERVGEAERERLANLEQRLAAEGILVNEVRPGVIATDMTSKVQGKYDALIEKGTFPIARWGTPEDVAGAVSLLCSARLRYTTGNYLDVDGGFNIQRL